MRRLLITTLLALAVACSKQPSAAKEKTFPMTATIAPQDKNPATFATLGVIFRARKARPPAVC
jgi:hypothetical protein